MANVVREVAMLCCAAGGVWELYVVGRIVGILVLVLMVVRAVGSFGRVL
jgi:hypothetical protein